MDNSMTFETPAAPPDPWEKGAQDFLATCLLAETMSELTSRNPLEQAIRRILGSSSGPYVISNFIDLVASLRIAVDARLAIERQHHAEALGNKDAEIANLRRQCEGVIAGTSAERDDWQADLAALQQQIAALQQRVEHYETEHNLPDNCCLAHLKGSRP